MTSAGDGKGYLISWNRATQALSDAIYPPHELRLIVADRGPGIPAADLTRVVEPYVRLEASRSRETGGVGLGLTIARDAALLHGGRLMLENRAGGGLRATLALPR